MMKPARFHCPQSFLQPGLPELGAVALTADREEQQGSGCSLHAPGTRASLSHALPPGQQVMQAAPEGHFGAMKQGANSYHLPEIKRHLSEGSQPKEPASREMPALRISSIFREGQAGCQLKARQSHAGIFPIKYFSTQK